MDDLEEALRNIDVFCRILVKKIVENENEKDSNIAVEPIENLLCRKYIIQDQLEPIASPTHLIPLPQVEKPLVDIFEDDQYIKVLMQCRCKDQKVIVNPSLAGLQICKRECRTNVDGIETCTDECQDLNLPVKHLKIENMAARCNNNQVFEINIPKMKTVGNHSI